MSPTPAAMTVVDDNQTRLTTTTTAHHVLMVSLSAQGHLNPMLRLGKRLHSKGLHVTLATTEITRQRVINRTDSLQVSDINLEFFSDGLGLESDRADLDQYFRTVARFGPANLSRLIKDIQSRSIQKISCIVNNPFVPWVADMAAEFKIPCAMLWIQPCSLLSIYYRFYNKITPFDDKPCHQDEASPFDVPGLPLLNTVDLPSFILPSNTLTSIADVLSPSLLPTNKLTWVLANSFHELESETIRSLPGFVPIKPVGPLVSKTLFEDDNVDDGFDLWKADEGCMEWLDEQGPHSVVYVSFGSIVNLPAEAKASIASALEKTKIPFLWVMKAAEFSVVDGGPSLLGVKEAARGKVVAWAPQSRVLRHPSVGCFLTHCGWNSVLEALTAGVPLVCYPQWTDQPTNAKLVEEVFGVGLRLWPDKEGGLGAEEVGRCIEDVMVGSGSEAIRARAEEWRRVAKEAVGDGGSSDRNIQWFVDEIVKLSGARVSS